MATYEQYRKQILDSLNPQVEKNISDYNAAIDKQVAAQNQIVDRATGVVQQQYNDKINETKNDYLKLYDANEVQRKINERAVAETMANYGLTDSGLNRTQQTAVQLSYGNAKTNLSMDEQKAVGSLKSQLAAYLAEQESTKQGYLADAEANKANYAIGLRQSAADNAASQASAMYQNDVAQAAAVQKARISAASKSSSSKSNDGKSTTAIYGTVTNWVNQPNGNVTYYDENGNAVTRAKYHNPYNNKYNPDAIDIDGKAAVFSNGYQPNNVGGNLLSVASNDKITVINALGNEVKQNVFKYTGNNKTHYVVWDGTDNKYVEFTKDELQKAGVTV